MLSKKLRLELREHLDQYVKLFTNTDANMNLLLDVIDTAYNRMSDELKIHLSHRKFNILFNLRLADLQQRKDK